MRCSVVASNASFAEFTKAHVGMFKPLLQICSPHLSCFWNQCHVKILDMYLSKLPTDAAAKDNFYLQPLPNVPKKSNAPWFSIAPIGKNSLAKMAKEMCAAADISGHKTNHSLRATGAFYMFQIGVYIREADPVKDWTPIISGSAPVWTYHHWTAKSRFVRSFQLTIEKPARIPALRLRSTVVLAVCPTYGICFWLWQNARGV